ncbi:hypothetical protein IMSHALPRED_002011 [Imshaugia aleurites]|uniref:Uncharacterized protein n=1 Tax=Imshaugia aleurites TaxID=172621 RepID=A0A8H3J4E9_9LECA|nr:hypothetical protein IMSHALPRED_002011 [Imshaugia aleurites]
MYLQSVSFALVAVLPACIVGQTGQTAAASTPATTTSATTTSPGHFEAVTSLGGVLAGEISSYFAQLLPSATSPPTPDEINEPLDIIIDGRIFPPVIYDGTKTINQDFSIDCANCDVFGNISLSGGGKIPDDPFPGSQIPTPADVLQMHPDFDFSGLWVGATFDQLSAHFEFTVILNASNQTNQFTVALPSKTFTKSIGDLTITATLSPEIYGWINTTNNVNFTYGFDFEVPAGSELLLPLESLNNSISIGFNQSTLTPTPFASATKNLNLAISLSFQPTVLFVATIGGLPVSVQASVTLDIPKLSATVAQVHHVNVSCDAAPASLPANQVYENLTLVTPSIGVDALEVFQEALNLVLVKPADTQPFSESYVTPLPTACYAFSRAEKTLVAAVESKPQDTSSAAGVCVPLTGFLAAVLLAGFVVM